LRCYACRWQRLGRPSGSAASARRRACATPPQRGHARPFRAGRGARGA